MVRLLGMVRRMTYIDCATFTDYIRQDLRETLTETIHKAKFFSMQMDGSTDCANIEEELFLL